MTENDDQVKQLFEKFEILLSKQEDISAEMKKLRDEINNIKTSPTSQPFVANKIVTTELPEDTVEEKIKKPEPTSTYQEYLKLKSLPNQRFTKPETPFYPKTKGGFEKFIGENLINKIGIAITIIGVAIGAKYSIENELISPLTRIILGYLVALTLLGFGIKLKKNYANYSAVLVSGAIAILYFITFFAYGFYHLIPQVFAFSLMFIFTAFTILAAIQYNKQIIAHIGLVGAYAVPFLLGNGSGQALVLFSYMAIINGGILSIAFKKYWKPLYYVSFVITWVIFFLWFIEKYNEESHFSLALIFLTIFFATFYLIFLGYKLIQKEKFGKGDIVMLLGNAFIFYGLGYTVLNTNATGAQLLGVFTLANAIVHFLVCTIIYKQKLADKNMFYLLAGLVLVFITITIPVQLDGHWVTLLWVGEAALLFWIGRAKNISVYEKLSYPLMFLALVSLLFDWSIGYSIYYDNAPESNIIPLLNIHFLSSILFIGAFSFINYVNFNKKYSSPIYSFKPFGKIMDFVIPSILLFVIHFAFRQEISFYWQQLYADSSLTIKKAGQEYPDNFYNYDLSNFKQIWILNYTLLFFTLLSFANILKIKNRYLGIVNSVLSIIVLFVFLTQGLYALSELRDSYVNQTLSEYYKIGVFNIGIRYVSFACIGLLFLGIYKHIKRDFMNLQTDIIKICFDLLLSLSILWIASSELITWLNIMGFSQSYKLGLSILWGVYALLLIAIGIWKKKKHLRLGAIVLFAITLVKLFFYDISDLNTISKTIVFVSLGVLLLIISFIYNKYKHIISPANES